MQKTFFSVTALALSFFLATTALAQTTPVTTTSDGGDKTKTMVDGMTVKTKAEKDGKMKVKGKDDAGNRMKATTKPRKGDMAGDKKMNRKMKKGMMKDSTMHSGM